MTSSWISLLSFFAILGMIPMALRLFKRTSMGGGSAASVMRAVAALPLSPSQRVLTIEVGQGDDRKWLVLGVTAQQITLLHSMPPQPDAPTAATPVFANPPFAQMLMEKLRQARRDNRAR